MKDFLTKIAIRKAVGLNLGEHDVSVVKIASTPLGPVVIAAASEPCTPDTLAETVERLLMPLVGRKRRVPVAVGIAGSRVFFGTRLTPSNGEAKAEIELQKALCSTNLSAEDLVADLLRGSVNKLPVAHLAACQRKYMTSMVAMLSNLGIRPARAEPAACSLLRLAESQYPAPRRARTVLRVFLGNGHGLAMIVAAGLPLAWKAFTLPEYSEGFAILSAARGLAVRQTHYGIEATLEYALIHGRPDLHERLQMEGLPSELGTRVVWHEGPELNGAATAHGLALGCLTQDAHAFDLAKTLKSAPPIMEIFPWAELSFAAGLIGCMAIALTAHAMKLNEAYMAVQAANTQHVCLASGDEGKLERDKKALEDRVSAVQKFLESRVDWTSYTRDISVRLPKNAVLSGFSGQNTLETKGNAARSFQLRGTAPLAKSGAIPYEIDSFLGAIPNDPLWKHDFNAIATDIRLPLDNKKELAEVEFSINCGKK